MIKLVDVFWTVQGEGLNAGRRALFVRVPFCNLQCPWCDTEFNHFSEWDEDEFKKYALQEPQRFSVITGGEPSKSKETLKVIDILKPLGFELAMESNGTFPIPDGVDYLTVSPKKFAREPYFIHEDAFKKAKEFKYVVDEGFDWTCLERHDLSDGGNYYLSPEWGRFDQSMDEILEYIRKEPRWRISLQTHKIMKVK